MDIASSYIRVAIRSPRFLSSYVGSFVALALWFCLGSQLAGPMPAAAQTAVLTQHNDNARSGANLTETQLTSSNVNTNQFGFLFSRTVDDQIYAQPLVMTNVDIPGYGFHNIVYVVTVNDSVYAFDADDASVTNAYWTASFIDPPNIVAPRNTDMTGACSGNYKDFSGNFGIVGTPVIDPVHTTLYLVARTKEFGTNYVQRLYALDLATGTNRPNSPVIIAATNSVAFDPYKQNQRPALLLANGYVYISWSSHCDWTPYHGWVMAYNTSNLLQSPLTFNDTTSGGTQAGIWMSNGGPAADTNGNVYLSTGNGTFDGVNNFGECFLKLTNNNAGLRLSTWFAPYNWSSLNGSDLDLGTGGVLLIPGTSLMFSGGKAGVLYLVKRDAMGGVSTGTSDTNIVQSWSIGSHPIHGGPAWWTGPNGSFAYVWGASSARLGQYQFTNNSKFATTPIAQGPTTGGSGQPGGILSVSANGTNAGSGIVWAAINTASDANQAVVAGTLHAYNAQNVAIELWNSDMVARDSVGSFAKFVSPTIANGKVYLATFSNRLNVYGLQPPPPLSLTAEGSNLVLSWPSNTYSLNYTLQSSTNLQPGNWTAATNSVQVSNGNFRVTVPSKAAAAFYRLKH